MRSISRISPMVFGLLFAFALIFCSITNAEISFPNFSSVAGLQILGSAEQVGTTISLTDSVIKNNVGAAWYIQKQSVGTLFETSFQFRVQGPIGNEADGFAFIIHNDTVNGIDAIGQSGGSLGYSGITNALAVEFDTFENGAYSDSPYPHIAVIRSTQEFREIQPDHLMMPETPGDVIMLDQTSHTAKIQYNGNILSVYMDNVLATEAEIKMDTIIGLSANGQAWVGFTGATGGKSELNEISSWTFSNKSGISYRIAPRQDAYKTPQIQFLFDLQGRKIGVAKQGHRNVVGQMLESPKLATGIYLLPSSNPITKKELCLIK